MVQFISLGSPHGGCNLGSLCRKYNQLSLPFDWMYTKHKFVTSNLLNNFNYFNIFDKNITSSELYKNDDNTSILSHITPGETIEETKIKYKRRCDRFLSILNTCIVNSEYVIFLRQTSIQNIDSRSSGPLSLKYPIDNYFVIENIEDWELFFENFEKIYPKLKYKFICFSKNRKTVSKNPNIIITDINTFISDYQDIIPHLDNLLSKLKL